MKTRYIAAAVLSVMIMNPYNADAQGKSGTAANVNGEKVTVSEIKKIYDDTPQINTQTSFDEFYPKALEVMVNSKVLYQAAKKAGVESSKDYKEQLELARRDIAGKAYLKQLVDQKVTDNDVRNFYNEYKSQFTSEKELNARHILVDDEATANDIIAQIKKGGNFDELAAKYSKEKNHKLGWFSKAMMVPEFGDAAFRMKKGQYSQKPIKTQFGYHIIIVDDMRDSKPLDYKEAAPQLKAILTQQAMGGIFQELSNNAKIERYNLDGSVMPAPAPTAAQ